MSFSIKATQKELLQGFPERYSDSDSDSDCDDDVHKSQNNQNNILQGSLKPYSGSDSDSESDDDSNSIDNLNNILQIHNSNIIPKIQQKNYTKSKFAKFEEIYLDDNSKSKLIKRDNLSKELGLAWTSGDSIFRFDNPKMKHLMYCYISKGKNGIRFSWNVVDISKNSNEMWSNIFQKFNIYNTYKSFSQKALTRKNKDNKAISGVKFLQFHGRKPIVPVIDQGIRDDIRKHICSKPCCVCFRTDSIECDHKNDLKNNPRVLVKSTQILDDFQPLCKHCNMLKKSASQLRNKTNKRIGATRYGFSKDFTIGDDTFNRNDPYWYKGTYWGDVMEFKKSL